MPTYDETVIQQHTQDLYDRSDTLVRNAAIGGAVLGALIGAAVSFVARLGAVFIAYPATMIPGALVLGWISAHNARREVARLRLQAQTALCQMMIQRNTARMAVHLHTLALDRNGRPGDAAGED